MSRLLYSKASPYGAKARMAAALAGYPAASVQTDTWNPDPQFLQANPLGKIPVLITDDGRAIHDSRVIVSFIDRQTGGKLLPRDDERRLAAEQMESFADGISDCLQAIMSERRFRPEAMWHQPWIERQWSKVERSLDSLSMNPPDMDGGLNIGHLAVRCMIGYLQVRFSGKWEPRHQPLVDWAARFDAGHPELAELLPRP